jgi:hypothetical protein
MSKKTGAGGSDKSFYSINSDYKDVPLITSPNHKEKRLKKNPFSFRAPLNKSHTIDVSMLQSGAAMSSSKEMLQRSY